MSLPAVPTVPADLLRRQIAAILRGWGMPADQAAVTAGVLIDADLAGIDSHGAALLPLYDEFRRGGKIELAPTVEVVRDFGATAVIDGGGGLGAVPASRAIDLAVEKSRTFGVGAVAVRNAAHFGAAGIHARRAAERGAIGIATSAVFRPAIVPTFGAEPRLGTNPLAFAAPAGRNRPFLLDMATSTAAIGKLKLAARAGAPLPEGWAVDARGRPETGAERALADKRLTPLGGTPELGGHKGYGLATMVEILSTTLAGATFAPLRSADAPRHDVGHFLMAIQPEAFREPGAFEADLDDLLDALRATPPADPARPVLVAGDPEHAARERRARDGIPLPPVLADALCRMAEAAGAPVLLAVPAG